MTYDFGSEVAHRFPPMVMFDITNVCNAECVHCAHPVIKRRPEYRATHLSLEHHQTVIDEVRHYPETALRYTADGEPLLHPRLIELLAYTRRHAPNTMSLTTNGERLTEDRARQLLEIGVHVIDVSIDAYDRQTFETIRKGLRFDTVTGNVRALVSLRNRLAAPTRIMVSIVRQPQVEGSVDAFIAEWEAIVDKVLVRELHTNVGMTFGRPADVPARHPCAYLWNRVVIACNGAIKFCPIDWLHQTDIHRVGEISIAELWQGDIYQRLRQAHLANDYDAPELAACKPCTDWRVTPWVHGYDAVVRDVAAGGSRK